MRHAKKRKQKKRKENERNYQTRNEKEREEKEKMKPQFTCWESNPPALPPPTSHLSSPSTYSPPCLSKLIPSKNISLDLYTLLFYETLS
jgi:hypothetical protein